MRVLYALLICLVMALTGLGLLKMDTEYTHDTYIQAKVVYMEGYEGMTGGKSSHAFSGHRVVVEHADGFREDFEVSLATFTRTEVGQDWARYTSPQLRGEATPVSHMVRFAVGLLALVLGGIGVIVFILTGLAEGFLYAFD